MPRFAVLGDPVAHSASPRLFRWLAGPAPSVADISCSAYVFLTREAGLDPARWPAVVAWLERIRALPGWVEQYRLMAR